MDPESLTPVQRARLDGLREELRNAEIRASVAIRIVGPDQKPEGEALTEFEQADREVLELRQKIKELLDLK